MKIPFSKYQGTGNDFILIDQRETNYPLTEAEREKMCDRKFGIGADGLITLNPHPSFDFEMKNYNADGRESSMCGNGGRCLIQFAHDLGMVQKKYRFLAIDGEHEAELENELIHLKMQDVHQIQETDVGHVLNTGSPHLVQIVKQLSQKDVFQEGKALRHAERFQPAGLNVNFLEIQPHQLSLRTFERGVEDETLSCGTGTIASAIVFSLQEKARAQNLIAIQTRGGELKVSFETEDQQKFTNVWLIGPAQKTFSGIY